MYDSRKTYDSIDEESNALLPGSNNGSRKKSRPASKNGLMVNRILVIMMLAGLVAVSIWLQSMQTALTEKLSTDEDKIQQLESTVLTQGKIIARFNESVTNKDVIGQLETMEDQWDQERTELFDQLNQTKLFVQAELDSTMVELASTVEAAEKEINQQVDEVKVNFEQYAAKTEHQFSMENNFMKYQVAGTFTVLSCLISMWHMGSHERKMNQPVIQRKILAILWMCPIYAVTSCLSLVLPTYAGYLGIIKDFYEAYIIYQFLSFCISAIGGGDRNKVIDLLAKQVGHLNPPFRLFFCCCKPYYENDKALASAILLQCQFFAIQFVFWKPVTAISMVFLKKYDYYGPYASDALDWKSIQFWIVIIQNVSTFVAFAGLLKFYHAVDKELQWCRPFAKFLCIKGVVFMTFWQGSALKILAETTDVGGEGDSADIWSEQIQNFLICMEMLLFSIAHFYCFPVEEWQPGYKVNFRKAKFGETMALNDFFTDLKIIMTTQDGSKKKKKRSKEPSESTIPEEEDGESETVDDSVSAMDSSVDEEDAKDAFVRALTSGINSYENENEDDDEDEENSSAQKQDVHEAQERLGSMLSEMLFSPKANDDGISSDENKNDYNNGHRDDQSQRNDSDEENGNSDIETEDPQITTGLLTGEHATSLTNNLRPSIFTNLSQQQQIREVEDIWAEDIKNEEDSDGVSNQNEEGDLEEQEDRDIENTVGNNSKS